MDDDKYPEEGRRNFVKKVVGAGVLGSAGMFGVLGFDWSKQKSGIGGGKTSYLGIEKVIGPAPRGMPQIPLEIENGELMGRAPAKDGSTIKGFDYSWDWFQYCGIQSYPGVQPKFKSDDKFRYNSNGWQGKNDLSDKVMKVSDFSDWKEYKGPAKQATEGIGKPGWGTWRSENVKKEIPVAVIKTDKQKLLDNAPSDSIKSWIDETCPEGFIAWLNKCTHFCCVPQGFQQSDFGCNEGNVCSANMVYCQCHQTRYNPFNVVSETMFSKPKPEPNEVLNSSTFEVQGG
ncbi:MAG: ubiquinol-cytochrome c reductase iron-sulfur subunit [Halobacteria archaeon]